jgi:RND family efflux transporter MFP subunit
MKQRYVIAGAVVAAVALGIWWYAGHGAGKTETDAAAAKDASVLVQTKPIRQERMPVVMQVFGEVGAGLPQALSFPQAGQLARLALVLGQAVHRGDVLAVIASDPAAVSSYAQAASAAEFARHELQRNQQLLGLKLATESQVDAARKQLADANATLAAQARLGGAHASAQIIAPFDGVVTALPVAQGDRVAPGATVVQLGRTDRLRALLAIEPAQSRRVKAGMPVTITPVQDGATAIDATIAEVQDMVDSKTQMVTAIAELAAAHSAGVVAGTRVEAAIRVGERQAWAVPRQAVLSDDKGAYLFQVAQQRARRVGVTKVAERGDVYGVDGPVNGNLPVVVLGNYELGEGVQVREAAR